ncbi:MAG TPA: GNAT family N-acetyltransferase [Myxococcales bacterium]|nr:GNAT family N-acetyltransferase [Myxococcales bacterium]
MTLRIRPAGPSDRDVVRGLLTAQMVEHRLPAGPDRIDRGLDAAFRPGSPAWLFLAERDGQAVGVFLANPIASVEKGGETLWIEELYVTPGARRTGVARALLAHALDEARRRGLRAFDLEVVPTQAAALALYRALGFEDVPRQRMTLEL